MLETSHVSFGNVSRRGPDGVTQLIDEFELSLELRFSEEFVHVQLQLVSELPGDDVFKLLESGHAGVCSKRMSISA
jgi:hypothetical protein